jgi:hypothetical protein
MNALFLTALNHKVKISRGSSFPWKKILRRTMFVAIAAPLVIVPAAVLAVVAVVTGPPIPVAINGAVGVGEEAVDISGQITIATRIIPDPDFGNPPSLELILDFNNVKANGKVKKQDKFATEAQVIVRRPLVPLDGVEVTFPYTNGNGNNAKSTKSAVAKLSVSFNASTGVAITSTVKDIPPG